MANNHTVILSSHILAEVRELCDYILIIAGGKLVAEDTPENLENLFNEEEKIVMEVKGEADDIRRILGKISGSGEYKLVRREEGIFAAEVTPEGGRDIREDIFFAFAEAGLPVISLAEKKNTLEEIYLKLTQGGGVSGESHI